MRRILLLALTLAITIYGYVFAQKNPDELIKKSKSDFFIENKGQWLPEVKFLARMNGMNAWITDFGVVYDYYKIVGNAERLTADRLKPDVMDTTTRRKGHVLKMKFVGRNNNKLSESLELSESYIQKPGKSQTEYYGEGKNEAYYNYFIGNDSTKWASYVGLYDEAIVKDIYNGIDIRYYYDKAENGQISLRYDFIVNPGADISQIKMKFEGADGLKINENGELVILTSLGEIKHQKLFCYQKETEQKINISDKERSSITFDDKTNIRKIECKFHQNSDGTVGFTTGEYDKSKPLVIDPLVWSTYLGGNGIYDYVKHCQIDESLNLIISGNTNSTDFPTTSGAYDQSHNGGTLDLFVTKINSSGSSLIFSTFIGGSSWDATQDMVLDGNYNIILTGHTLSSGFPTTSGVYDQTHNGGYDNFVTKLNINGSSLIFHHLNSIENEGCSTKKQPIFYSYYLHKMVHS